MREVRQMIAEVLSLPSELVLDAASQIDVSKLTHFVTVIDSYQNEIGSSVHFNGINEIESVSSVREVAISVNAYGLNAYDLINKLVSSMKISHIRQRLRKIKLGYLRASQVRHLPTAIAGGKEQRAQVDLIFSINHKIQANVNRGDSVQINTRVN